MLFQSWPDVEGTFNADPNVRWDTTDAGRRAARHRRLRGRPALHALRERQDATCCPAAAAPATTGYDPRVDGTVDGPAPSLHRPAVQERDGGALLERADGPRRLLAAAARVRRDHRPAPRAGPQRLRRRRPVPRRAAARSASRSGARAWRRSSASPACAATTSARAATARFGRRDFVWHSGGVGVAALRQVEHPRLLDGLRRGRDEVELGRRVHLGRRTSTSATTTRFDGLADGVDLYRLTISVDRPTFVNFLNANRTFFINTQWFFQYMDDYESGFTNDGPVDIFGVLAISTGYFQDRLLPSLTLVYFVRNNSVAVLPAGHLPLHRELLGDLRPRRVRGPRAGAA